MNIVEPYAKLMPPVGGEFGFDGQARGFTQQDGIDCLRRIEWCGRTSHRSEDAMTGDSYERFIRAVVLGHGDWSIVEHASASVDMLVDRGITHELVRHRLFAFTQESTRFVNYEKKMPPSFIQPCADWDSYTSRSDERSPHASPALQWWQVAIESAEAAYRSLIHRGVSPQIARSVFPNALASRIVITGNLRNWRHFFLMRTTKEAHPQMRQVTLPLLEEFKAKIPILFEDIEPLARQVENIAKGR